MGQHLALPEMESEINRELKYLIKYISLNFDNYKFIIDNKLICKNKKISEFSEDFVKNVNYFIDFETNLNLNYVSKGNVVNDNCKILLTNDSDLKLFLLNYLYSLFWRNVVVDINETVNIINNNQINVNDVVSLTKFGINLNNILISEILKNIDKSIEITTNTFFNEKSVFKISDFKNDTFLNYQYTEIEKLFSIN